MFNTKELESSLRNIRNVSKIYFTGIENLSPDELKEVCNLFFQYESEAEAFLRNDTNRINGLIKRKLELLPQIDDLDSKIEDPSKLTIQDMETIQGYFHLPDSQIVEMAFPGMLHPSITHLRDNIRWGILYTDVLEEMMIQNHVNENVDLWLYFNELTMILQDIDEGMELIEIVPHNRKSLM